VLLRIRIDLSWFCSGHPLAFQTLRVVVTLSDARLAVDVGQSHLSLFVQLPIEGHGIFKVIFVAAVVEETEANGIDYFYVPSYI